MLTCNQKIDTPQAHRLTPCKEYVPIHVVPDVPLGCLCLFCRCAHLRLNISQRFLKQIISYRSVFTDVLKAQCIDSPIKSANSQIPAMAIEDYIRSFEYLFTRQTELTWKRLEDCVLLRRKLHQIANSFDVLTKVIFTDARDHVPPIAKNRKSDNQNDNSQLNE